jgi:hypothetical protein
MFPLILLPYSSFLILVLYPLYTKTDSFESARIFSKAIPKSSAGSWQQLTRPEA